MTYAYFNQKRIITIFLMVFVSLFAFSFKIANNNMLNKEITTETVALPVTNRVIVIDADMELQMKGQRAIME